MKSIVVPPGPSLLESMRSVGYSIETAVADIIDNSIAAEAESIDVLISPSGSFEIAIVDDGSGMDRDEAVVAMTLAPSSPSAWRNPNDLGRFGLGLKTASLSQCRTLTLVTKKEGSITAFRWSLDHVSETGKWSLIELGTEDCLSLLGWTQLNELSHGTLVHWSDLDQLTLTEGGHQSDLDHVAARIRDHVALVFHLFNGNEGVRRVGLSMNGSPISPIDPYMSHSKLTNRTDWESIEVEGEVVRLVAYTLPYLSRLSVADRSRALQLGPLRETQGFYVYRAHRLVIWGNWFRVMPRSEMAKLTRVRVDIPNSLDHLWALDVKKSHAEPPPQVRRRLSELARTMMQPSRKVQEFRGRTPHTTTGIDYMWLPRVNGDEFSYEINPDHPTIKAFTSGLSLDEQKKFSVVLEDLQTTFPLVDAHNRLSGDGVPHSSDDAELVDRAVAGWHMAEQQGWDLDTFVEMIARSDPYCLVDRFEERLRTAVE